MMCTDRHASRHLPYILCHFESAGGVLLCRDVFGGVFNFVTTG